MAASEALNGGNANVGLAPQLGGKLLLLAGAAAVIAVMAVFWMWSQQPDYRVLFSNYADKDGGAIVASLEKMNVPYKFSESGTAILVPAAQVHQARLKLAAEGLPKGGNIGFELLENQKFGVSQFVEQVNFQRALEGELERSIQSIGAVDVARIHLAIPKPSVFVRDQLKPTASVLLNLRPGRTLDPQQVSAIVHLVASSIPDLPTTNVTVVDQNGDLLSDISKKTGINNLDPAQLKYVEELQQSIARRVEAIIAPIVGAKNVHAEASAEVDFSSQEQAAEIYKPNQKPEDAVVRSMQSNESASNAGDANASGIPGALSNQPPAPATAPVASAANATPDINTMSASNISPFNTQKNITTNYEVDKTVRYVQQPMGGVKRLTVAVVVNNIQTTDKSGKVSNRALTDAEKKQINDLAMQAMGFSKERGDSLTVVNSSFAGEKPEVLKDIPLWKQPETIEYAKDALRFIIGIVVLMMLYKKMLKPMLNKLSQPLSMLSPTQTPALAGNGGQEVIEAKAVPVSSYEQNLGTARQIAMNNPKMVANVVAGWTNGT